MRPTPFRALPPALESQRFLARARQFRRVAIRLADMDGPEPNWPKWFLVTHAIELAIKAFIVSREDLDVPAPAGPKPANHDLVGLYDYAVLYGLQPNPLITSGLPHLSELHRVHYARYPHAEARPVALIAQFDDLVDQLLTDITEARGRGLGGVTAPLLLGPQKPPQKPRGAPTGSRIVALGRFLSPNPLIFNVAPAPPPLASHR
jgi:hypothetical protein